MVHLPRHQPDDPRVLHVPAQPAAREGSAAVAAGRRHLRQDADLGLAVRCSRCCTTWSRSATSGAPGRLEAAPQQHPRRRGRCAARTSSRRRDGRARDGAAVCACAARPRVDWRAGRSRRRCSAHWHGARGARAAASGVDAIGCRAARAGRPMVPMPGSATAAVEHRAARLRALGAATASGCTARSSVDDAASRRRPARRDEPRLRRHVRGARAQRLRRTCCACGTTCRHQRRDDGQRALPAVQCRPPAGLPRRAARAFEGARRHARSARASGPLRVYFLAGRMPPIAIENPRQVSAYRYPTRLRPAQPDVLARRAGRSRRRPAGAVHLRHREHRRPRRRAPRRRAPRRPTRPGQHRACHRGEHRAHGRRASTPPRWSARSTCAMPTTSPPCASVIERDGRRDQPRGARAPSICRPTSAAPSCWSRSRRMASRRARPATMKTNRSTALRSGAWWPSLLPRMPLAPSRRRRCRRAAPERPLWELGLGVGGLRLPRLPRLGPDRAYAAAGAVRRLSRRVSARPTAKARARCWSTSDRVEVDLSVAAAAPTRSRDNAARDGMPDLPPTVEIGPNFNFTLLRARDALKLELRAAAARRVHVRESPRSIGCDFLAEPQPRPARCRRRLEHRPASRPAVRQTASSTSTTTASTGLRDGAAPGISRPGGYAGWQALAATSRRFGNTWLGAFAALRQPARRGVRRQPAGARKHAVTARHRHRVGVCRIVRARHDGRLRPALEASCRASVSAHASAAVPAAAAARR